MHFCTHCCTMHFCTHDLPCTMHHCVEQPPITPEVRIDLMPRREQYVVVNAVEGEITLEVRTRETIDVWQWVTCDFNQYYNTDFCCHCGLYMRYIFLCQDYTMDERLKSPHCARCLTDMSGQFFDGDCNRNALAYRQQCIDNDLNPDE